MARFTLIKTSPLLVGMLVLAACPGDDTPLDTEGTSTSDDPTSTMGPTTMPPTTTIDPDSGSGSGSGDSSSTSGDPCAGVMCEEGEECIAGQCFTCGQPTCEPGCGDGETCQCPPDDVCCDVGMCSAPVCPLPPLGGNYAECLDDMGMTSDEPCDGGGCIVDDDPATAAVCMISGCDNVCQCPPAPETGDAPVNCEDVTGDMVNDCWLLCDGGETCPDGMICFGGFICLFSDVPQTDIPLYGDCINSPPGAVCDMGFCLSGGTAAACSAQCTDVGDCEPAPATGDAPVTCMDVTGDMMPDCILDCSDGQTCPDGMICFADQVCFWEEVVPPPPVEDGYDPCVVPGTGCEMGEVCAQGMAGAWEVCVQDGCMDATDCTETIPPGGTAVAACGDPDGAGGVASACYLDCAGGATCPTGMFCADGTTCAWAPGTELFSDDFEDDELTMPAWALYDEDGLTPNAMVNFVDAAWIAGEIEMGNSTAISTSWYMPAGISDDWMVTPQIMVGPNAWLSFASRSIDANFPDILEVLVSTTGNTPADFTDPPVVIADPETEEYTNHSVGLAAAGYANTGVYIAFRNRGEDGTLLLVDNVQVVDQP